MLHEHQKILLYFRFHIKEPVLKLIDYKKCDGRGGKLLLYLCEILMSESAMYGHVFFRCPAILHMLMSQTDGHAKIENTCQHLE